MINQLVYQDLNGNAKPNLIIYHFQSKLSGISSNESEKTATNILRYEIIHQLKFWMNHQKLMLNLITST